MITLCIIADTHQKHRQVTIPPCDLLIHCGDFGYFERDDRATLEDVDAWFAELPADKIVCIGGNHDFMLQRREFRFSHAELLEDSGIEYRGLRIYGSPWCPELPFFAYHATEPQLIEKWRRIPSGIDVLITHTPPRGILDLPFGSATHVGCPHLKAELKRIRPRVHAFGHIHHSHGRQEDGGTLYLNAAVVTGRELEVTQPATVMQVVSGQGAPAGT